MRSETTTASRTPHYHHNSYEALCVLKGWADLAWGMDQSVIGRAQAGDVVFHPPGFFSDIMLNRLYV